MANPPVNPTVGSQAGRKPTTDSTPSTDIDWRPHPHKSWITDPCATRYHPLRGQVSDRPGTVIQVRVRDVR